MSLIVIDPLEEMLKNGQRYINNNPEASVMQIRDFLLATLPETYWERINRLHRQKQAVTWNNYGNHCVIAETMNDYSKA